MSKRHYEVPVTDQFREILKKHKIGEVFTWADLREEINKEYGTPLGSIIPSDHCYNMSCKGDSKIKFFLHRGGVNSGLYEYVGENYQPLLDEEYSDDDRAEIERLLEDDKTVQVPIEDNPKEPEYTETAGTKKVKRNNGVPARAFKAADYKCEYDPNDRLFLCRNGKHYYTEAHHLIPISLQWAFENSLDVEANVVSLCSHCHNLIHYGRLEDKKPILEKLYNERKDRLEKCGIILDGGLEELYGYYM